ncbi:uncharacterized protein RB166_019242 [Leptodactylus fuscus]|uniref:uncharacterized protein LOC142219233 n=1 Tax=Leptodactylus fuscus TaxID=238119 RepID=UPI003F4E6B02
MVISQGNKSILYKTVKTFIRILGLHNQTPGLKVRSSSFLVMSSPIYENRRRNQDYEPSDFVGINALPMRRFPPTDNPRDDHFQPPAYHTLPDLPVWTIPLPESQSDRSLRAQQWTIDSPIPPTTQYHTPNVVDSQTPGPLIKSPFWKSPLAVVGAWLVIISFLPILGGVILTSNEFATMSNSLLLEIPFWSAACYVVTGSLCIMAHMRPFLCQVGLSLGFSILTVIVSCVGLVFNVHDLESRSHVNYLFPPYELYILIGANIVALCLSFFGSICGFGILCRSLNKKPQEPVTEDVMPTATSSQISIDLPEMPSTPPPPYIP